MRKVAEEALNNYSMSKQAGSLSETLGSFMWAPAAPIGALAGLAQGPYIGNEYAAADRRGLSNLVPFLGPYRLARRLVSNYTPQDFGERYRIARMTRHGLYTPEQLNNLNVLSKDEKELLEKHRK